MVLSQDSQELCWSRQLKSNQRLMLISP